MNAAWKPEIRATLRLAVPVVTGQVGMVTMNMVDIMMVGHMQQGAEQALAATALGSIYAFAVVIFGMGVLHALDPVISHAVGARDRSALGANVQRGVVLALALAVPACLLAVPASPVFHLLQQPTEVIPIATDCVHASIPGMLPFLLFVVLRQTLQALSRLRPVVLAVLAVNILNALLDWALIHGNFGCPALGAVGSAWATSACRLALVGLLLVLGHSELGTLLWPLRREALRLAPLGRMLRLGAPIGLSLGLEFSGFMGTALLLGFLGTTEVAGHQVAISLASLTFMVPLGLSSAAAVRVGYAVGRGDADEARRPATVSLVLATLVMTCFAALFLSASTLLAGIYSHEAEVVAMAATLIQLAGVFQVFDGLQVVGAGVLRGLGDTVSPVVAQFVGFWVLGLPLGMFLVFQTDIGAPGPWWGLVVGLAVAAVLLLLRVRALLRRAPDRIDLDA